MSDILTCGPGRKRQWTADEGERGALPPLTEHILFQALPYASYKHYFIQNTQLYEAYYYLHFSDGETKA